MRKLWQLCAAVLLIAAPAHAGNSLVKEIRAVMSPGGISLRHETRKIGAEDVVLHLYVVPKGRGPYAPVQPEPGHEKKPITREDITVGPSLVASPFFLDLFTRSGSGKLTRLHSIRFTEEGDVNKIVTKWLQPARRRGPILALHFGATHWHTWWLIVFPQGFRGEPLVQSFLWGGEGEEYLFQRLDQIDKRGFMLVEEEWGRGGKRGTRFYHWDGTRFVDRSSPYFIIAASVKTRAEAKAFKKRKTLGDIAEVDSSSQYKRLAPDLFIVILGRYQDRCEAAEDAAWYRREGIACYVKRAF